MLKDHCLTCPFPNEALGVVADQDVLVHLIPAEQVVSVSSEVGVVEGHSGGGGNGIGGSGGGSEILAQVPVTF